MLKKITLITMLCPFLVACNPDGSMTKAEQGALIGGLAGAAIGKGTSNHKDKRAIIGGAAGAMIGASIGAYMDQQEQELRQVTQGTNIDVVRRGDNIILNMPDNITFDTGSSEIKRQAYRSLNHLSRTLSRFQDTNIIISGHTDDRGTDEFNQQLSERRANSVRYYLLDKGIPSYRVRAIGYGEMRPIADNRTSDGRAKNRRVEITLQPTRNRS